MLEVKGRITLKSVLCMAIFLLTAVNLTLAVKLKERSGHEGGTGYMKNESLQFFKSLDYENGLKVVVDIFSRYPLQYGTTLGMDGNPQIRPIEFKFEEDGVLYFDTVVFYSSYKELCAHPYIQLCVCDQETMTYIRLGGKVNFTDDKGIVDRCFESSEVLTSQFGHRRDVVVAYYLTDVWAEFSSFSPELQPRTYSLPNKYDE